MPDSLHPRLKCAVEAALRAGRFLSASRPASAAHLGRDIKLDSDRLAENIILESLGNELAILSEETGLHGAVTPMRWIVDPLDGSMNFLRRVPFCCVSIGLWHGMEPVLGVIYDFNHNELFTGIVGQGAWLNDESIRVSEFAKEKGILCTGLPVSTDLSADALTRFVADAQVYKKVRLLGSAALSLAYVAAGRVEGYRERDIKIWDVAAGIAIVRAAGGFVGMAPARDENAFDVYASNEKP